ncbi:MAG: M20/M25/M40 family metallo-hydrolase [Roseiflexaceae bacterium]|nr:M20/M25/M40 family metallo-hydrolase [Roseiflexaceae bacterium]
MLVNDLRQLCAIPSSYDQPEITTTTASHLAALMTQRGLQSEVLVTAGAPVVVGRRAGRSPFTLLLYHHYDTAPPGPWRTWNHEPFQLAEREGALFGRGVAEGKGPLVAHLAALASMIAADGELPISVVVIAEGEGGIGSPHLGMALAEHREHLRADACLATGGERDAYGVPICYSGSKGLLQTRLTVVGPNQQLKAGLAASVPNPLWRLVWALGAVKSAEEEVLIEGFYDDVESPNRAENQAIRSVRVDEQGRLAAWGIEQFLFGMTGATLITAETTLPTAHISGLSAEPFIDQSALPVVASARLDFQLVARQRPQSIVDLLRAHLREKGFEDVAVERLSGGYPATTSPDHPFIERVRAAGQPAYAAVLPSLPMGPFALPLFLFSEAFGLPVAAVGCARHDSNVLGANEHIPLADLVRHSQMLIDLLASYARQP